MVPDVPSVEKQLTKSHEKFDQHPLGTAMLRRIFGCRFRSDMGRSEYAEVQDAFMNVIAHDSVDKSAAIATLNRANIGRKVSDLVRFNRDPASEQPWELMSRVNLVVSSLRMAEVHDLEILLKVLSSCTAITVANRTPLLLRTRIALLARR